MIFRRISQLVLLPLFFCSVTSALSAQAAPQSSMIDIGGHKLNVRVVGTRRAGVPIVVFENGLGGLLGAWNAVQSAAADSTMTIAYERSGIGASQPGSDPPTLKRSVAELHTLLANLKATPPYVLVGHSYGAVITNAFAATYPGEVAGIVHVDPTDFTQTEADIIELLEKAGVQDPRAMISRPADLSAAAAAGIASGMLAEAREVARAQLGGFAEFRAAGTAPDVPLVVLLSAKREVIPPAAAAMFPGDFARYRAATLEQRLAHFAQMTSHAANGTLLVTTKSGHSIHVSEPDLVVWSIRRVLAATSPRL